MVSIIGGGPAGATCAYYLAENGFDVTLYEALPNKRKPCAGGLRKDIFRRYEKLVGDLGSRCFRVKSFTMSFDDVSRKISFKKPFGYVIDRLYFDRHLRSVAKKAGCKIVRKAVNPDDVKDDIVIDARGAYPSEKNGLMIASVCKMKNPEFKIEFVSKYNTFGYFWIFPISKDTANIGVGDFDRTRFGKLDEGLDWYIRKHGAKVLWRKSWHESANINKSIITRRPDGTLVIKVGERAGFVSPMTGEGIYYAMESGEVLASAISGDILLIYRAYIKWMEFKFMVFKLLRDIVLWPTYKPAIGFAGAWLVGWKSSR